MTILTPSMIFRTTKHTFKNEEGGYQASDDSNKPLDEIYFMGIIDILQVYNWRKQLETSFKVGPLKKQIDSNQILDCELTPS